MTQSPFDLFLTWVFTKWAFNTFDCKFHLITIRLTPSLVERAGNLRYHFFQIHKSSILTRSTIHWSQDWANGSQAVFSHFLPPWDTISHLSSSKCYFHLNLPEAGSARGSIGSFPVSSLLIGRKARWPSLIGWLSARGARRGMRNDGQDVITMSFTENSGFAVLGSLAKNQELGNHFRSG